METLDTTHFGVVGRSVVWHTADTTAGWTTDTMTMFDEVESLWMLINRMSPNNMGLQMAAAAAIGAVRENSLYRDFATFFECNIILIT